jgi:hypothetical protein
MTTSYTIEPDRESLKEAIELFEFVGGNTSTAVRVAINKAGPQVRTKSSQEIRKSIRLKAAYVNEKLGFKRATNNNLNGRITTPSRGLLLSRFSTNALIADSHKVSWIRPPDVPSQGIRVKVKPTGGFKTVRGDNETQGQPFFMVLPNSGALAIAARRKPGHFGPRGGRIKVFYGPSISQVFNRVKDEVPASEIYTKQLIDAMRYVLVKRYPSEAMP